MFEWLVTIDRVQLWIKQMIILLLLLINVCILRWWFWFQEVAVKLESQTAKHPQLLYESKLYKILQGGVGIPHCRFVTDSPCFASPKGSSKVNCLCMCHIFVTLSLCQLPCLSQCQCHIFIVIMNIRLLLLKSPCW